MNWTIYGLKEDFPDRLPHQVFQRAINGEETLFEVFSNAISLSLELRFLESHLNDSGQCWHTIMARCGTVLKLAAHLVCHIRQSHDISTYSRGHSC